MKTVIISPTYNEQTNITDLIKYLNVVVPEADILIVDDNSPDGTAEVVKKLQPQYKNLYLEVRPGKKGLGVAYRFGFQWALERGYEAIVQMDADMSHDPSDVPALLKRLKNHDLVIGSRYSNGISVVNWPLSRLILSYTANFYSRVITGLPIKDATGGFKAWRSEVLASIDLNKVRSQGYSFQIEMNFRTWIKGYSIGEYPIIFIDRTIGESKMSRKIMIEAVFMVWRLRIWKIFGWHK